MPTSTGESFQKEFWESTEKRRSPDHPAVVAFAEPKVDFIRRCIEGEAESQRVEQILEIGCGNGYFTRPLARWADCIALDFSRRMLELNPIPVPKACGRAQTLPFRDNSFDLVFSANLLHHIPDALDAVQDMKRVAKRYVALVEPNRSNPLMLVCGALSKTERGVLRFSRGYMLRLARDSELDVSDIRTMGTVLPNKTPKPLVPLVKLVDWAQPWAFYHVMVCRAAPTTEASTTE